MIRRSIFILAVMLILPAVLYAGTLFEDEKRTSDPYVGEKGGFNSLFVNPAGTAGQSGFELSLNVGGNTTSNDIKLVLGLAELATGFSGDFSDMDMETAISDAGQTFSDLYDAGIITEDMLDAIFDGTDLDPDTVPPGFWDDPAQVQAAIEDPAFDSADTDQIEANLDAALNDPASSQYADFYNGLPAEVSVTGLASLKTGFLIKGFGLGVYDHAVGVAAVDPDPVDPYYGINTIYNELGIIAGGGINLLEGKLAVGFSGNYGVLMRNRSPVDFSDFASLWNDPDTVNFGYTWGVDLGAIWRPTPSLGVGLVFNDIIGYTEADTPGVADGFLGLFESGDYLMDSIDYSVTFDIDAGITWQPDWRFVKPKFSFDMYNVVGYARDVIDYNDDFEDAMYRTLEHMRFGANFTFFEFLKLGTQYYDHYLSAGIGLDLLFLEIYGDFKVSDEAFSTGDWGNAPLGADLMVRLHF